MSIIKHTIAYIFSALILILSLPSSAKDIEITVFAGQMYSSDLVEADNETELSVDNGNNFGLAFAWQDTPNGQGQILLNFVSHDFSSASEAGNIEQSIDIIYAHFNGIAQFRQQGYVTTISLGLGGAYFDTDGGEELYPSITASLGTRYEFSESLALVTEIRGYGSLIDENDNLFCKDDICTANFDDSLWLETSISVGIAYKF